MLQPGVQIFGHWWLLKFVPDLLPSFNGVSTRTRACTLSSILPAAAVPTMGTKANFEIYLFKLQRY